MSINIEKAPKNEIAPFKVMCLCNKILKHVKVIIIPHDKNITTNDVL